MSGLFLQGNDLEGIVPMELGNAGALNQGNFSDAGLTGCIPPNLQRYYATPIIGHFIAEVARTIAKSMRRVYKGR